MVFTKKVLAVFPIDFSRLDTAGLREKCEGLMRGAQKWGIPCDYAFQWKGKLMIVTSLDELLTLGESDSKRKLKDVWYQHFVFWRKLKFHCENDSYAALWIRLGIPTHSMKDFVSKSQSPIYLDIPTYPFIAERRGIGKLVAKLTHVNLKFVASRSKFVFSPTCNKKKILGRPSLSVQNGVDTALIRIRDVDSVSQGPPFRLVGFAQWSSWHGIDRLIKGIAVAGLQDQFEFCLAGSGTVLKEWKKLASKNGVAFQILPPSFGFNRDELIANAHAGLGTLATFRRKLKVDASLKNLMYIAYGVPVIVTEFAKGLKVNDRVFLVNDDEEPLDGFKIYAWLLKLYSATPPQMKLLEKSVSVYDWSVSYQNLYRTLLNDLDIYKYV